MKYKYYSLFIFLICLSWIVIACSNNIDYTYKGRNYIQMSTSDDPALSESDERAITVDVLLATSVENDAVINFELLDNADDILRLENGAVQIKAGEKTARFKVLSNRQSLLNNQRMITLNPVCLVYSSIDEDNWENEPSDWIEPKGMFNEKTFSFQFPWDHVNSLGYTQIRVTYTLNE